MAENILETKQLYYFTLLAALSVKVNMDVGCNYSQATQVNINLQHFLKRVQLKEIMSRFFLTMSKNRI